MKKILSIALTLLITLSIGVGATSFKDVNEDNVYLNKAVNLLTSIDVAKGISSTEFGTEQLVTREQMSAFLYRLLKKGKSLEGGANTTTFTDLEDPTYFSMISWAASKNLIKGTSATTFDPKGGITLQDCYTIIVRALGYEEEEIITYPYGFIEIAESIGLDKGLNSTISYEDELTRGDVAIILYNTFFAQTNYVETIQKEKLLGKDTSAATWVLVNETNYPTFCEKYFDLIEAQYQVVATPHYAIDGNENTNDFGYNAIYFKLDTENTDNISELPEYFYWDYDELNLDTDVDEQIMGNFTMYVTVDDNEIDTIFYAEPLMKKVTTNDIRFKEVSNTTKASYMINGDTNSAKVLSGEAIVNNNSVYFYNAPYSYLKPSYTSSDKETQYLVRNEDNVNFIEKEAIDIDDGTYNYNLVSSIQPADLTASIFADASYELIKAMPQAYFNGLYEATFYDIDGDNRFEYVEYLPYSFAIVDTDDDYTFADDGIKDNIIYTFDANINVKVHDDDFIIGYFNQDTNEIKVAKIIEPITSTVTDINKAKSLIKLGKNYVSVVNAWKYVNNYNTFDYFEKANYNEDEVEFDDFTSGATNLLSAAVYDAKSAKYYVYKDTVLYVEDIKTINKLSENIAIITNPEDGSWFETGSFNSKTGKREYLAYAWVNGKTQWISIETDVDETNVYPKVSEKNEKAYLNRICNFNVDAAGVYTLTPINGATDEDGEDLGLPTNVNFVIKDKEDETLQAYGEYKETTFTKVIGRRYCLDDDIIVTLTADTKIVILNKDTDSNEYEFVEYDYKTLTDSIESVLTDVQFVIQEDTAYTNRANLVFMFAKAENLETATTIGKKSDRFVISYNPKYDKDLGYYYAYTVFNPYTGKMENTTGNKFASKIFDNNIDVGVITSVSTDNEVEDKKPKTTELTEGRFWMTDYDEENECIEVIPVNGDISEAIMLDVSDAVLTYIGDQETTLANICDSDNYGIVGFDRVNKGTYKPANTSYFETPKSKQSTIFAKYPELYISYTDDSDDFDGTVEYAIALIFKLSDKETEFYCEID